MRKIIILALLLCSTIIVQAQSQIDSIKFIDTTTDSLVYIVHSSISSGVTSEYYVECEKETDNVNINILYLEAFPHADCYCPVQTTIKIEKDIYLTVGYESKFNGTHDFTNTGFQSNLFARANILIKIEPALSEHFEWKAVLFSGFANANTINAIDSLSYNLIK